jgi:L-alanine-DL-glutamate epimerase-like enolase superfamily enzyme
MVVRSKGGIVVEVETDEGLVGLGEAGFSAEYFSTVGPVINQQLAPLLHGRDPLQIGEIWEAMYQATHLWGRRGVETYALSGIDIALWDLMGKVTGQPVHRLLGSTKTSARAYFAPSLKPAAEMVPEAAKAAADGFAAMKLRVGFDLDEDLAIVRQVREAVGPDVDIMVDANMAYDRRTALRMAHQFEEQGVAWLEEPIRTRSVTQYLDEHTWLSERVNIPLAGGESLLTRYEYIDAASRRTFDVLQPDCTTVGGISEAKKVADLASAWGLQCVPHIGCSSGTGIGLAAGLQLILASANSGLVEFDAYGGPGWDGLLQQPIDVVDGKVHALEAPGLGVALAPDARERFAL